MSDRIIVHTYLVGDTIIQEVTDLFGNFTRSVLDTREQAIREKLIALGWTPPKEEER